MPVCFSLSFGFNINPKLFIAIPTRCMLIVSSHFIQVSMQTMLFHWNTIAVLGFFRPTTLSIKPSYKALSNDEQKQQGTSIAVSVSTNHNLTFHCFLRDNGFSETQISKLVQKSPTLLNFDPEKTLLPKIQFLSSIGISGKDLARVISSNPRLLRSSLEKQLIPCHNFLKNVAYLQDKQVIAAFKRRSIFTSDILNTFTPNVALLRQLGVPQSSISFLFTTFPQVVALKHSKFVKAVEDTRQMGFDPSKNSFVLAIRMLYNMTDSKWESKCEIFGKWGWSKDDTIQAFRKFPLFMNASDKKIMDVFDFLVNKVGWTCASKQISQCPSILSRSLEKNIVPRCYVIRVLQLNGLVKQDIRLSSIIVKGEKYFLDRYVTRYEENVPQLLDLYKGKVDLRSASSF